jgi:phosphoglycolate phosphatase-like HAD superfamily hydrolase
MTDNPTILALDFDGVICDGLREYFQTAWKAYAQIWQDTASREALAPQFYRLRPVVETGWEMPVLIKALVLGIEEAEILQNWAAIALQITTRDHIEAMQISTMVDDIRDRWIASDLESWLAEHRFYPGVLQRLTQVLDSPIQTVIISTKEGRFIQQLLRQRGIQLADEQIYGKEVKRPKAQILRELTERNGSISIWFIEDRLKTLQGIEHQPGLENVTLFLADWGYNTDRDRQSIRENDRIHLLSLQQFSQAFSTWQ